MANSRLTYLQKIGKGEASYSFIRGLFKECRVLAVSFSLGAKTRDIAKANKK